MEKADGLSRRSDWKVGVEKNNKYQKLIKEEWICSLVEVVIEELWNRYNRKSKNSQSKR